MIFWKKPREKTIVELMRIELRTSKQNYLHHVEKMEEAHAMVNMYASRIARLEEAIETEVSEGVRYGIQAFAVSDMGTEFEAWLSAIREREAGRDSSSGDERGCGEQKPQTHSEQAHSTGTRASEVRGTGRGADSGAAVGTTGLQQNQQRGDEPGRGT